MNKFAEAFIKTGSNSENGYFRKSSKHLLPLLEEEGKKGIHGTVLENR